MLIVQKYGGSSLATPKHIQRAALRIKGLRDKGVGVVVVASAMGHTTDHLIKLAKKTVKKLEARELDMLLTAGERVSMSLLAMSLHELGVDAVSLTGSQSGIITDSIHTQAKIVEIRGHRMEEGLKQGKVVIVAGFQGVSREKEITTLGRGGSDTTAVAVAAALKADQCEILTDVSGIYSADPRIVKSAHLLNWCSYDEALELSHLGAKMHPRSIELAKRFSVKIMVGHSGLEGTEGTRISQSPEIELGDKKMEALSVKGIATLDGYRHFSVDASFKEVGPVLEKCQANIRFFNYDVSGTRLALEESKAAPFSDELSRRGMKFQEVGEVAVVSVVGEGVSSSPELIPAILDLAGGLGTEPLLMTANTLSVSILVPSQFKAALAEKLHSRFCR